MRVPTWQLMLLYSLVVSLTHHIEAQRPYDGSELEWTLLKLAKCAVLGWSFMFVDTAFALKPGLKKERQAE